MLNGLTYWFLYLLGSNLNDCAVPKKLRPSRVTYLLTLWKRVFLEKLTSSQLVQKFPAFYGTRRFMTAFTSACHLFLSWAIKGFGSNLHTSCPRNVCPKIKTLSGNGHVGKLKSALNISQKYGI